MLDRGTNELFSTKRITDVLIQGRQLGYKLLGYLVKGVRRSLPWIGALAAVMLILAFTSLPYYAHRWLGIAGGISFQAPARIIVLGGSGMPSGPELLRLHYAAEVALAHPMANVTVVHSADTAVADDMITELKLRGIDPVRINTALEGGNTREQALLLATAHPEYLNERIALVTAPENMYRSLAVFRKLGFQDIHGIPAFDNALFSDLRFRYKRIGGKAYMPDVSDNMALRYNFWNYLKLEITCLREAVAYTYYKLNGWV